MRRIAVVLLVVPFAVWYWPQWAARDFARAFLDSFRSSREARKGRA